MVVIVMYVVSMLSGFFLWHCMVQAYAPVHMQAGRQAGPVCLGVC